MIELGAMMLLVGTLACSFQNNIGQNQNSLDTSFMNKASISTYVKEISYESVDINFDDATIDLQAVVTGEVIKVDSNKDSYTAECKESFMASSLDLKVNGVESYEVSFDGEASIVFDSVGGFEVPVTVTADDGRTVVTSAKFIVKDTVKPVIKITTKRKEVREGSALNLLNGVTASDSVSGDLTKNVKYKVYDLDGIRKIGALGVGKYKVVYYVKDDAGNTVKAYSWLVIKENEFVKVNQTRYTTSNIKLRKWYGDKYAKVLDIKKGTKVTVIATIKGSTWVKVKYDGKTGYCDSKYLSKTKPTTSTSGGTGNTSSGTGNTSSGGGNTSSNEKYKKPSDNCAFAYPEYERLPVIAGTREVDIDKLVNLAKSMTKEEQQKKWGGFVDGNGFFTSDDGIKRHFTNDEMIAQAEEFCDNNGEAIISMCRDGGGYFFITNTYKLYSADSNVPIVTGYYDYTQKVEWTFKCYRKSWDSPVSQTPFE